MRIQLGFMPCRFQHRLRGSASHVLTATGFVNGKWQFSIPCRIYTPQLINKIFFTGDYVGDHYSCAKLGAHSSTRGLLGTWVKYNQNYFYLCPFWEVTRRRIFTHDGSNDAISRPQFARFRHNLAWWRSLTLLTALTVKNFKFHKSNIAAASILKNR